MDPLCQHLMTQEWSRETWFLLATTPVAIILHLIPSKQMLLTWASVGLVISSVVVPTDILYATISYTPFFIVSIWRSFGFTGAMCFGGGWLIGGSLLHHGLWQSTLEALVKRRVVASTIGYLFYSSIHRLAITPPPSKLPRDSYLTASAVDDDADEVEGEDQDVASILLTTSRIVSQILLMPSLALWSGSFLRRMITNSPKFMESSRFIRFVRPVDSKCDTFMWSLVGGVSLMVVKDLTMLMYRVFCRRQRRLMRVLDFHS